MQKMRLMMVMASVMILGLLVASVAFAAEGAGQGVAGFVDGVLMPILKALATVVITAVVPWIGQVIRQKTKIQISKETEDFISTSALKAVSYVEELAAQAVKNGATGWTSTTKLGAAVDKLLTYCPTLTTDQAIEKVHEAIGLIPGLGASAAITPAAAATE